MLEINIKVHHKQSKIEDEVSIKTNNDFVDVGEMVNFVEGMMRTLGYSNNCIENYFKEKFDNEE